MLGYDHESFWHQTPRTLALTFTAFNQRLMREHNARAWLAWHTAVLSRQRKIEPLRKLLLTESQMVKPTMEQQIEGLKKWVIATGGKIIYQ